MPVWLVTGGSGFLGRHLLDTLAEMREIQPLAMGRRLPDGWPQRAFLSADLEEPESVARAIRAAHPEVVIHAAGRTPPGEPDLFYRANTLTTLHLLDALRATGAPVRLILAGSAAELGPVAETDLPVAEDHACRPADAYGMSKWLSTCAGLSTRPPLEVIVARVFNLIGPGQPLTRAFGRFAAQLNDRGGGPRSLAVGDLDARRDFVDVRDAARALVALASAGRGGRIYHVGTGISHRVGDGLAHLIRRSARGVEVRVDPGLTTNLGPRDSRADIRRIVAETGWRPRIAWEQSLDDLWDEVARRIGTPRPLPLTA